ncbi:putative N-acetylglucosaminyl-phosphatidylinositol de-N-acetylase isoform X1 [Capsicum annuum]|uniref:probable N-acetylglucosaminyl-phosphatidylinositol de-N-acetylase isoform X1 n=1 Tax=Capsicum annuum TaxID=4072 RepID=UPI0007BF1BAD|nr:probable N-acetylglucosaminyl-phosphatidylinositol de-N-acetylase isoform X1 [Capsicum annuum]
MKKSSQEFIVITFDNYGVSGHCNHQDVHQGVRKLLQDTSHKEVDAWELVSTNILRKYSGPVDIWLSLLSAKFHLSGLVHCLLNEHPRRSLAAMAQHTSQWVWFRKLFVSFSSYPYVNCLKKIN